MFFTLEINSIIWLFVALASLIPFTLFSISYQRIKDNKLLITAIAFFLFFIKAAILAMKIFLQNYDDEFWWSLAAILDVLIISLISLALLKKDGET